MSEFLGVNPNLPIDLTAFRTERSIQQDNVRLTQAVQYLNRTEFSPNGPRSGSTLKVTYDSGIKRDVVSVVDQGGNVIYQMPSDECLRMAAECRRKSRGG